MLFHKPRTAETRGLNNRTTTSNSTLSPASRVSRSNVDHDAIVPSEEASISSTTSARRRTSGSGDTTARALQSRPSALPRSVSSSSQARLSYIASTRPTPTYAGRSPPLQAMTLMPPAANMPRLDTSNTFLSGISYQGRDTQTLSPVDVGDDTVLGVAMPRKPPTYPPTDLPPKLIPELQALAASNNRPVNPASSSIGSISSPSTVFTSSSSPWSASTTTTTPISWSSASPGITQPATSASSKRSYTVPIPANVRARTPRLPVVKENQGPTLISKATLASDAERGTRKSKESPEPTPPPRSSSLKRIRSRSDSTATTRSENPRTSSADIPSVPAVGPSISTASTQHTGQPSEQRDNAKPFQGHSRLQEAINSEPRREPSRVECLQVDRQTPSSGPATHSKELLGPAPIAQSQHRRFPSLSRRHARQPSVCEGEPEKQSARSRLAKFSRLAIFGRSKTTTDREQKPQKLQSRKGPAAGTGHEGYSRFGRRGRKNSLGSSTGATDSETSVASVSRKPVPRRQSRTSSVSQDQSDIDEFAASRMKPVVMLGGSLRGRVSPFPPMPKNPQLSDISLSTMSSAESYPAHTRSGSPRRERFPPEGSQSRPTLATRRSRKFARSDESFRFPEPIETQDLNATPCLDSRNTTQSSDIPTPASTMYKVDPSMHEKYQRSKSKKLRWNVFRRKDSMSDVEEIPQERPNTRGRMSVNVAPAPVQRPIPYYAMLGSDYELTTTAMIGQVLRDAAESPDKEDEVISVGLSEDETVDKQYFDRESILLPTAPVRQATAQTVAQARIPRLSIPTPSESTVTLGYLPAETPVKRQPRLAQVGRIPKVIPTRQQAQPGLQAPQDSAFQNQLPTKPALRKRSSRDQLPNLTTKADPIARNPGRVTRETIPAIVEEPQAQYVEPYVSEPEFLQYSETRNSDFTTSSDSTGIISVVGPPFSNVPIITKRRTDVFGTEDDVWNEYDDFMDDIMSPSQQTISAPPKTRRSGKAERKVRADGRLVVPNKEAARAKGLAIVPASVPDLSRQFLLTPPMPLSSEPSLQEMLSSEEIRLRRSRIAPALHTSFDPSSPFSERGFIAEYGRPRSGRFSERLSGSSAVVPEPIQAVAQPREHSRPRQYEDVAHLEEMERTKNPTKHSDQQYASLMVSRWLSFGRVLFSPAHAEIEANPERHVLVVDGLGSEDWSIYCAVTYQAGRAFVHDLKERRHGTGRAKAPKSTDSVPPNHRRAEIPSFNDEFPFPPGFFTAIVVRFPPAMPDSKLKNIISECRRVLSPGGYLELMILDLDIVNMGVQTRRAIKDLKIKMSTIDKTVSLKPIIDNVQTVLGSNGFSNMNRCLVGVPVVGKSVNSTDSSSESRSSTGSTGHRRRSPAGPRPYGSLGSQANFSLNDLVADHSEHADAKIGRMVSRTARSWWQHCFEAGIIAGGNASKSVFNNKEVMNECKMRAANFKLLIAYAQKSIVAEGRRRTMSEPAVPTLATAGTTPSRLVRT